MTGRTISHYRIHQKLGEGGMGVVYEAEDINLERSVALKFLHPGEDTTRLLREAKTAASLAHPNICSVHEVDPERGFLAMELIEGKTLKEVIGGRPVPVTEALRLAIQIGEGLAAAHARGIIHRDIKPANIMVSTSGMVKLMDFGLARVMGQMGQTQDGGASGTPGYMAPEQARGESIDGRTDIWALGAVLHEMLTGRPPIGQTGALPEGLGRTVRKALAANPDDRYQHAEDLVVDLRRAGNASATPSRMASRRWLIAGGSALLLLAGYWFWTGSSYRPKPAALEWYEKGMHALRSLTYESARKALQQAVAIDPQFALAHGGLAQAYEELDYTELAKESMLRAVTVAQETRLSRADSRRLRAFQLVVARDYDRAAPLLQQMESAASAAGKPAAALECGWLAQRAEKTAEARKAYERALKLDPAYAPARLRLGHIQQRNRELDQALKSFQEAERLYLTSSDYEGVIEAIWGQANLLIRFNRPKAALPLVEKALSAAPTVGSSHLQIRLQLLEGIAYRYLGEAGRAEKIARLAIDAAEAQQMDSLASSGLVDLGNAFLVGRKVTAAEPVFQHALTVARRSKMRRFENRALLALASICEQTGRPAEGRNYIEAALPFYRQAGYRREVVQATILLGSFHSQQAEYEKSIGLLRDVLQAAEKLQDATVEAQVRERLAQALRDQGDWPSALEQFDRAAKLLGSTRQSLDARLNGARLRWKLGRSAEAALSLAGVEQLIQQHPNPLNSFDLMVLKSEIAYDAGQASQAATLARKALALPNANADARSKASLLLSFVQIRGGTGAQALPSASSTLTGFENAHRDMEAAHAHLALAEALVEAGQSRPARDHALQALAFLEPRRILEATWRAHLVAARAAGPGESGAHRQAAISALASLKSSWPAPDVERYLERPDIRLNLRKL